MDAEQQRIEDDLRGQIAGDVHCDDLFVQMYASDASVYEVPPLGVVRPRIIEDVIATVKYAASRGIPMHARGAGSGLAGGALGRGLVIDFSRFMRKVLETGEDFVRVESGVVLDELNRMLAPTGRYIGPDPATKQVTTVGSMVALDASGSHWPAVGSTRRHVKSVQMVLADGEVMEFGTHELLNLTGDIGVDRFVRAVDDIATRHAEVIEASRPKSLVNSSGYRLDELYDPDAFGKPLHLARLLVGSEGTLGLITAVTFGTLPIPAQACSALLFFDSIEKATLASLELQSMKFAACDLMDRRHLSLAREMDPRYEFLIPQEAEAVLLVEFQGETVDEVQGKLADAVTLIQGNAKLAFGSYIAADGFDHEILWQLARHYTPTLYRLKGHTRPLPFVEDMAVPPVELPNFLPRAQEIFKQEQVTASLFGHVGHGQLHFRPFLDLGNAEDIAKMDVLADKLYEEVWRCGGTISGEHGDGLSRSPYVARQFGPLMPVFQEVKQLFDPQKLMNPGKIVTSEVTSLIDHLRHVRYPLLENLEASVVENADKKDHAQPPTIQLQLAWQPQEMAHAARVCNGCGVCRTQGPEAVMCPINRYSPREEASPRAKANLARGLLTGVLPQGSVLDSEFKEIVDLCVHCHMCRLECPANVDIPRLMVEAKALYTATNGETLHGWFMARVDDLCHYASRYSRLANWAVANRGARWVIEKLVGVPRNRKLPRFRRKAFVDQATQKRINRPERLNVEKVLYFVDTYANFCDQQLAEAFLAILEHNGIPVYVPENQLQAAMPMIARGIVAKARGIAEHNVGILAEAVRQGYTIVTTEPSAALALTHEYPQLLPGDHDAEMVAENTFEACHYLWRLHQRGKLQLNFGQLNTSVGYHTPCHTKALEVGTPAESLLRLIPGLKVELLEKGCSGMAGTYGLEHKNYRRSLRAGLPLITAVRQGAFVAGTTECSTCKLQMEQSTSKPTIHPVKIVALAYGLMPELRHLINSPGKELVVT
jgi:FAD/FMN-containing dehydrogenase/Fe-S oxidoreductase